jgi:hypothetical protein
MKMIGFHHEWETVDRNGWVRQSGYTFSICLMNGVVMKESLVIDGAVDEERISEEVIREELSRILESSMFIQSDRLGRFLRFIVETTLAGDAEILKEYVIGTQTSLPSQCGLHCSKRGPEAPRQIKGILRIRW